MFAKAHSRAWEPAKAPSCAWVPPVKCPQCGASHVHGHKFVDCDSEKSSNSAQIL